MDSINKNQPEKNHDDLQSNAAIKKIKDLVESAGSCFFCTDAVNDRRSHSSESSGACPMAVKKVDDQGNLWFLSASDSHKNKEININPSVKLFFQGSAHSDFLFINGDATISTDPIRIKELWEPILKTWFTEGINDPRITVIKVTPREGYYWDTKHGHAVAGIKMLIGAAIGKTLDDSIEGKLNI
ncbi:MAG: pyridoxamine 5'-phosphate oxidase family protein [Pseudomonadota bacterium]